MLRLPPARSASVIGVALLMVVLGSWRGYQWLGGGLSDLWLGRLRTAERTVEAAGRTLDPTGEIAAIRHRLPPWMSEVRLHLTRPTVRIHMLIIGLLEVAGAVAGLALWRASGDWARKLAIAQQLTLAVAKLGAWRLTLIWGHLMWMWPQASMAERAAALRRAYEFWQMAPSLGLRLLTTILWCAAVLWFFHRPKVRAQFGPWRPRDLQPI
jgi:hypothetical protein